MKKILLTFGVAAMVAAGVSSCGSSSKSYTPEQQQLGDSVAVTLGQFAGAQQQMQFERMRATADSAMAAKFTKADFLRGLQTVLNADTNELAYFQGLQMGLQIINPIMGVTNDANIPVSKDKVLEAFKQVFEMDSVADMQQYYTAYQEIMEKVRTAMTENVRKAKAESPEAKKNLEEGQAYQAKALTQEGYKKSSTGLIYKIDNEGTGDKIKPGNRVTIYYHGRKIDGTVFDETQEGNPYSASSTAFIPGFNEALGMLGKGGKMTVVIPADLAYGLDGAGEGPNAIGPNETLEFDIEVNDVTPDAGPDIRIK